MAGPGRLVGWVQIARYLDVDRRTAIRWEADERLKMPVFNATREGTVVAFISDLDAYKLEREKLPPRGAVVRRSRPTERERAA